MGEQFGSMRHTRLGVLGYELPLSDVEFRAALRAGLGRAMQHARVYGVAGHEAAFLQQASTNPAFDRQLDGDQSEWLIQLIDAGGALERLGDQLLDVAKVPTEEYWDALHRAGIARSLALRGIPGARDVLIGRLQKENDSSDVVGVMELLDLPGEENLLVVARFFGKLLRDVADFWFDDSFILHWQLRHSRDDAMAVLDQTATTDPLIANVVNYLRRPIDDTKPGGPVMNLRNIQVSPDARPPAFDRESATAEEVLAGIERDDYDWAPGYVSMWAKAAPDSERIRLLDLLLVHTDERVRWEALGAFTRVPLQTFDPRFIPLLDDPDFDIRHRANLILACYADPAIRLAALRRIREAVPTGTEPNLLIRNGTPEDASFIMDHAIFDHEEYRAHWTMTSIMEYARKHPSPIGADLLACAYQSLRCTLCRKDCVAALREQGAHAWVVDEFEWDVSQSNRDH